MLAGVDSPTATRRPNRSAQWALDALVDSGLAPFVVLDGTRITYASPAFLALVGWDASRRTGPASLLEFIGEEDGIRLRAQLASTHNRYRDIYALRRANGADGYAAFDAASIETGSGPRTVVVATDVSPWMRSLARLQRLAFEDTLTGLANRPLLCDRIEQAIATAKRNDSSFAVMLIDLDQFKPINDTRGHATGDLVLRETARRLQSATRAVDTVARLGGDEFVVLLGGKGGRDEARLVVERIKQAVTAPLPVHGLRVGVSVGVAIFPDDGTDADQLLKRADAAMYDAKHSGGNRHAFARQTGASAGAGARLAWLPLYRTGIEAIDKQHEQLVATMNGLWEAQLAGHDRALLSRGLTQLTCLLEEHFAAEERHMDANPYPGSAAHRADHERALETARSLGARVGEPSFALGIQFLYNWLLIHIRSYDKDLPRAESV